LEIAGFVSVIGLVFTLVGAITGVKGYLDEKESVYYSRASFYFFNLEYYSSMIIQKYKSVVAFMFIAIGTALQIFAGAFGQLGLYFNDITFIFIVVFLVILVWLLAEVTSSKLAWEAIKKRIVGEYYNEVLNGQLNEVQSNEKWCDLYFVMHSGRAISYEKINRKELEEMIQQFIQRV